jgi:hypothetical protein
VSGSKPPLSRLNWTTALGSCPLMERPAMVVIPSLEETPVSCLSDRLSGAAVRSTLIASGRVGLVERPAASTIRATIL